MIRPSVYSAVGFQLRLLGDANWLHFRFDFFATTFRRSESRRGLVISAVQFRTSLSLLVPETLAKWARTKYASSLLDGEVGVFLVFPKRVEQMRFEINIC